MKFLSQSLCFQLNIDVSKWILFSKLTLCFQVNYNFQSTLFHRTLPVVPLSVRLYSWSTIRVSVISAVSYMPELTFRLEEGALSWYFIIQIAFSHEYYVQKKNYDLKAPLRNPKLYFIPRVNPKKFQNFHFWSLNCHFWVKNTKNDNKGEFLVFHVFTLHMILTKLAVIGMAIFRKIA